LVEHSRLAPLILLCGPAFSCASGCASGGYVFGVAGQILDSRGKPLEGARVTLTTDRPVYEAATPVRTRTIETDATGWFAFTYITHDVPTPYVLLVEKHECTSRKVHSVGPPSQEHFITLECQGGSQMPDR
jgi:hypothetical protein